MDFPPQYQQWDAVEPVELFSAPVVSIAEGKGGIVKHLEREAKGVDYLVLWLDCDREGENICFEVIRCCEKSMNKGVRGQRIFRAKFSAVTPKDIEHAMRNLVEPNENESKAVEARQELDLKVGVAFSRFQTRYFQGKYGDLDSAVISYGPCQTPTLGFCVDRYDEIQTFSPEPFWTLQVSVEAIVPNSSGGGTAGTLIIEVDWNRDRVFDQSVAETFLSMVSDDGALVCTDIKVSETRKTRPQPMNTVELLKLASKNLGIGPHAAMRAAENLYLSGYLSYPRTESTSYPSSFNIREALQIQRGHPEFGGYVGELLSAGYAAPRQGHDAGDHPPITPVGLARDLSGDNARIYDVSYRSCYQQCKSWIEYVPLGCIVHTYYNSYLYKHTPFLCLLQICN
jgi:DNA topoisomerase-3